MRPGYLEHTEPLTIIVNISLQQQHQQRNYIFQEFLLQKFSGIKYGSHTLAHNFLNIHTIINYTRAYHTLHWFLFYWNGFHIYLHILYTVLFLVVKYEHMFMMLIFFSFCNEISTVVSHLYFTIKIIFCNDVNKFKFIETCDGVIFVWITEYVILIEFLFVSGKFPWCITLCPVNVSNI